MTNLADRDAVQRTIKRTVASLVAATATFLVSANPAQAETEGRSATPGLELPMSVPARDAIRSVAPALERYARDDQMGRLWRRPDLSPRDRSIVTLSVLIARSQTAELPAYVSLALDGGVQPGEISEIITHLAFYAGWGNAQAAIPLVRIIFTARGIGADQVPLASPDLLPLDETAEAQRVDRVRQDIGAVAPGLEQFTTDVLFRDLWLRPGLAPRDRSLATVSALIAAGHIAQVPYHLNRAMDNGLTRSQASELIAHLAFYAGWPNAFSAVQAFKDVLANRRG